MLTCGSCRPRTAVTPRLFAIFYPSYLLLSRSVCSVPGFFSSLIEEVVLLHRLLGPPYADRQSFTTHVSPTTDDGEVVLPEPMGLVVGLNLDPTTNPTSHRLLSPLVAPSMNFLRQRYPTFFASRTKYLTIIETTGRQRRQDVAAAFDLAEGQGIPASQSMVLAIGSDWRSHSGRGVGLNQAYIPEHVLTFIAASSLRQGGYIVDTFQERLLRGDGAPDMYAIRLAETQTKLASAGFSRGGFLFV